MSQKYPRDDARFEALYRQLHQDVFKYLIRYTGNRHHAEDLTEEAFVRAYVYGFPDDDPEYERRWLFTIARNVANTWYRRTKREPVPFDMTDPTFPAPAVDGVFDRVIDRIDLHRALWRLKPKERGLLFAYYGGEPIEQIAIDLGVPVNTVHKRLSRIRARVLKYCRTYQPGQRLVQVRRM